MFLKHRFSIIKYKSVLLMVSMMFFLILFTLLIHQKIKLSRQQLMPNILAASTRKPSEGRNIFFHETSGKFNLNPRQACAVESAALVNPDLRVFLLLLAENGFPNATRTPLINALLEYQNIQINYLNITQYAEGTPLEQLINKGELTRSKFQIEHTADVLRFLTLWKYGGTYLDLDVVVLKPVDSISNYASAESSEFVSIGIINMSLDGIGHEIADMCLNDLVESFNGAQWAYNGPGVLPRNLERKCKTKDNLEMLSERCSGFQVLPPKYCYAIPYPEHTKFFQERYLVEVMEKLEESIIAHVWNKLSGSTTLSVNSSAAYVHLAKQYCPKVIEACDEYF